MGVITATMGWTRIVGVGALPLGIPLRTKA